MCRVPFDVPIYRCRLIIDKVATGEQTVTNFDTTDVSHILEGFGLETIVPHTNTRMITDIHFDIEIGEDIHQILTELGLPVPQ